MKRSLEIGSGFTSMPSTRNHHEDFPHGSPQFRMSAHLTRIPFGNSQVLYSHWHEELEFFFFTRGQCRFQMGKEDFTVKERDIVIIQPNILHSAGRIDKEPCEFYAILVHCNFLSSIENDDVQQNYVLPYFSGNTAYPVHISAEMDKKYNLLNVLWSIVEAYRLEEKGYELLIKSKLFEAFYILTKYAVLYPGAAAAKSAILSNFNWVQNYLPYIQENYKRHITLADMARQVNMSEGHLCRGVKQAFGLTPMEFLNNYRVSRAVHLIETTDKTLGNISDETGFPNINRFTSTFKKVFHCTPIQYRMKLRQK